MPGRVAGVALLSLALLWPGRASAAPSAPAVPAAAEAGTPSLDSLQTELEGLVREVKNLRKRLQEFQKRFPDPDEPSAFPPRRLEVQRDLQARLVRAYALLERFQRLRQETDARAGSDLLHRTALRPRKETAPSIASLFKRREFEASARKSLADAELILKVDLIDAKERSGQRAEALRRRRMLRLLGGLGLASAALAAAWGFRRRRTVAASASDVAVGARPGQAAPPPADATRPAEPGNGDVVGGRFRVVRPLEPDIFGTVFEATDVERGRKVLLRRIRQEFHDSDKDLDRFLDMARRTLCLSHPHVAEVLSVFIEDGRVLIASEFLKGVPLSRAFEPRRGLDLAALQRLARQLLEALGHAHGLGVLHGALGPWAIVVGERELMKVRDFCIGAEARRIASKLSWNALGPLTAYMAPEQELGRTLPQSDIFSAAVILYEAAAGRLPFEGPDYLSQKRSSRYRPCASAAPGIPPRFDEIMAKALQPDPQARFQSAEELRLAIELLG